MRYIFVDNYPCILSGEIDVDREVSAIEGFEHQISLRLGDVNTPIAVDLYALELARVLCAAIKHAHIGGDKVSVALLISGAEFDVELPDRTLCHIHGLSTNGNVLSIPLTRVVSCLYSIVEYSRNHTVNRGADISRSINLALDGLNQEIFEMEQKFHNQ